MIPFSTADLALARRLEAAEAANGWALANGSTSTLVEAQEIAGGCALFAGAGSGMTHALGIGMNGKLPDGEFDRLEAFFRDRGSPCLIDLCPMADLSVIEQITLRRYKVIEFNNLMLRPVGQASRPVQELPETITITPVTPERQDEWCRLIFQGFASSTEIPDSELSLMETLPYLGGDFFAELDGVPVGGAAMAIHNGVAMLYGDATLPRARGKGVQQALIRHRVELAAQAGAEWVMACVVPGTGSHRNYERCGFNLVYMRVNLAREV